MTSTQETDYDVAILGAGPVGMALAALLVQRGMAPQRVALLDSKALAQAVKDPRSIALSHGSRLLFEQIGAWPIAATEIHQIHVSRRGQFGRSVIERAEHGVPALGYVARYGDVVSALAGVCERAGITSLRPAHVNACVESDKDVTLQIDDGRTLRAAVAVQAEGGLFGEQAERSEKRDYQQTAIIARVSTSAPIAHRAYERFTAEGPLALLPQTDADAHQYALVWCVHPERARALLALDDAAFLAQLGEAFGGRLGRFSASTARIAYPLGLNAAARATPRTVAIGNAAQTLHPVAGQGLNLGLRDAFVLARLLAQGANPTMLGAFNAERAVDRQLTVRLTDTMARAFAQQGPGQALLGLSLGLIDAVPPARHVLAELMMFGRR